MLGPTVVAPALKPATNIKGGSLVAGVRVKCKPRRSEGEVEAAMAATKPKGKICV